MLAKTKTPAETETPVEIETPIEKEVPQRFICPINQEIMSDPVFAEDGNTYERSAILQWFKEHNTSPITREKISTKLVQNNSMRSELSNAGHKLTKITTEKKTTSVQTSNLTYIYSHRLDLNPGQPQFTTTYPSISLNYSNPTNAMDADRPKYSYDIINNSIPNPIWNMPPMDFEERKPLDKFVPKFSNDGHIYFERRPLEYRD